jgi:ATP-dependent RNA helicase DeaD
MNTFFETGLKKELLDAISDLGFINPTPIQEKAIPLLLESDQDIIAFAQTGTGKTAAFGLPAIQLTDITDKNTQTLVLAPTRELCLQITRDLEEYSKNIKGINILAVYGGSSIENQIKALRKGAQIVVATPGRAKDLINRRKLVLNQVNRVVLDEADEMLTMGFKDDLDAILNQTPDHKQTLLFSATMSNEMARITKKYMQNPIELKVAKMNVGTKNVNHLLYMTSARNRFEALKRIIDVNPHIYSIVFCRTRRETNDIANKLSQAGYNADALNGDLSQNQRDDVMGRFRNRHLQILVATDVAARGIDVNDLTHVINYNLPDDPEIYTHRSGRTGRAGKSGISIVIVHSRETRKIRDIEKFSGISFTKELIPTGDEICQAQLFTLVEKIDKIKVDEKQIEPFLPNIYEMLEDLSREELIKHFVSAEFNRFLSYYKNAKDINIDEKESKKERRRGRNTDFTRLFINLGKKDKLTPARLLGIINEALDSNTIEIGKIDLLGNFSFFEIDKTSANTLLETLNNGFEFNGRAVSVEISEEKKQGRSSKRRKSSGFKSEFSGKKRNNKNGDYNKRRGKKRSGGGEGHRGRRKKKY